MAALAARPFRHVILSALDSGGRTLMLNQAIGDLLPSAFAVALSPIPIIAVVLVLGAGQARTAGPMFAPGWIAGLATVSIVVVLVLGSGADSTEGLKS